MIPTSRHVVMLTPTSAGGHARYSKELLTALAQAGSSGRWRFSLITSDDLAPEFQSTSYTVLPVLTRQAPRESYRSRFSWIVGRIGYYVRREWQCWKCITRGAARQSAVLHLQEFNALTTPVLAMFCRRAGIKVVLTVHNIRPHAVTPLVGPRLHAILSRWMWRNTDALIVHTAGLKQSLLDELGYDAPPVAVVEHGVWSVTRKGRVRRVDGCTRLLFFGVIRRNKGLEILLEAMKSLDSCMLRIVGAAEDTAYREEVQSLVAEFSPDKVQAKVGYVTDSEADEEISAADLLVLPYREFGAQSGVLWLAVAHGKPVVVTDVGALAESVRRLGNGMIAKAGDVDALVSALNSAIEPGALARMTKAAELAESGAGWQGAALDTLKVYELVDDDVA